jgi:hypothetical protein
MKQIKPYCVMKVTPSGEHTTCETRYGRWFASVDAAIALAIRIGGLVYERRGLGIRISMANYEEQKHMKTRFHSSQARRTTHARAP